MLVIEPEEIDQSLVNFYSPRRYRMATLDEIAKEKQRISEALARVDAQREKLVSQLGELEATERVLARYSQGPQVKRARSGKTPAAAMKTPAPAQSGRRRRAAAANPAGRDRSSPSLGDQILALATKDAAGNRRRVHGGSPEPYRHRHCPAQTGWPDRGA